MSTEPEMDKEAVAWWRALVRPIFFAMRDKGIGALRITRVADVKVNFVLEPETDDHLVDPELPEDIQRILRGGRPEQPAGPRLEASGQMRPRIVCLCGSTRFSDAFQAANLRETLAGNIVLSIGCDMKSDAALGLPPDTKSKLDELHLRKIDLADEVLILNVGGYIGESTAREVAYARERGKTVRFLEPFLPDKREPREWTVTSPVPEGLLLKCEATGETALVQNATPEERRQPVPRAWDGDPERVKFYDDYLRGKEGRDNG